MIIAWIGFVILILGVFWLAVLYEDWIRNEPEEDPDPLPRIKVYRHPYDWASRGDFSDA